VAPATALAPPPPNILPKFPRHLGCQAVASPSRYMKDAEAGGGLSEDPAYGFQTSFSIWRVLAALTERIVGRSQ